MKKSVAIIGGGTAGLLAASFLDTDMYDVTIYEKKASVGRKFLVAGDGGFNLTHSEPIETFIDRYDPVDFLKPALTAFTNEDFINWLENLNIPTFIGSSKRVFPQKGIKPIQVLNHITTFLKERDVQFQTNKEFKGWTDDGEVILKDDEKIVADYYVFALGGASWKITGSDGAWLDLFKANGTSVVPFKASNCAFKINWPSEFKTYHEGKPLKNIALSMDGLRCKGEIVVTSFGIEGNAIYALSSKVQESLGAKNNAIVYLDNKPMLSVELVVEKLSRSNLNQSRTLREVLKLNSTQVALIKNELSKEDFLNNEKLAHTIKNLPVKILASGPIDEAISTIGGISRAVVSENYELKSMKNTFVIGEMLNWNAPTGGYLIQGCVSMGVYLARYLNSKTDNNLKY